MVRDLLSTQFTAEITEWPMSPLRYSFYHDFGDTWKFDPMTKSGGAN